jgi:hypothetical protein
MVKVQLLLRFGFRLRKMRATKNPDALAGVIGIAAIDQ